MKKLVSFLLVLVMVLGTIPSFAVSAMAKEVAEILPEKAGNEQVNAEPVPMKEVIDEPQILSGTFGENNNSYQFNSESGLLTISGSGYMYSLSDSCGVSYSDYPWDSYRGDITKVVIENGISSVANSAFINCTKLSSVELPQSLCNIGSDAFSGCFELTDVVLNCQDIHICNYAFDACTSLYREPLKIQVKHRNNCQDMV